MERNPEQKRPADDLIPEKPTLPSLRAAAANCRACELWRNATRLVFGEGNADASVMFIGEQPGDKEDLAGRPFVGPAGKLLDKALAEAGIERDKVYVTNVVKHFNWTRQGKFRIHKKPNAAQMAACRPWLEAEIELIKPRVIVCLGATAAQAIFGREFRVTRHRGEFVRTLPLAPLVTATVHPSAILRAPDDETRHAETRAFVEDLKKIARALED